MEWKRSELYALAGILFAVAAYNLYWLVKALRFYKNNGWDFSIDFGPKIYKGDSPAPEFEMNPREKLLFGYPFSIVILGTMAVVTFLIAFYSGTQQP